MDFDQHGCNQCDHVRKSQACERKPRSQQTEDTAKVSESPVMCVPVFATVHSKLDIDH